MLTAYNGWRRVTLFAVGLATAAALSTSQPLHATSPPAPILISQNPLTVTIPAHPQIVFALANSQSMDGNLSGAIMTGSGSLGGAIANGLAASSSPANYTIPAGFTPPVNLGSAGQAPYTVNVSGTLVDNSPSRLNVAKAGIAAILNSFMQYADFSLMDYSTANLGEYSTWAYYMSPVGSDFTFTSSPPGGSDYVANPCYGADITQMDAYSQSCATLLADFGPASNITTQPYMIIGASSDDPEINDVTYAQSNYQPPVCTSGVPDPLNPYTFFGLADYNGGGVKEDYGLQWGLAGYSWACEPAMVPTNAGYVPYSQQTMQVMRGFGYDATSQSAASGSTLVTMQSASATPTPASVATAIAAFTPYLQPETNDPSTTEIKAVAEQAPTAGLVKSAAQYLHSGSVPSSNNCSPAQYIVLVTDGLPTKDLSGNNWPPLGTAAAAGYGVTSANDTAVNNTLSQIMTAAGEGIKTYVIGLGAGVDSTINPQAAATLTAMAAAGGTGNYFAANSPADLTADMQVILAHILAAVSSTSSATVNTTGINSSSMAFQPSFNTSDLNQDWTGDIKAHPIDAGGEVEPTLAWSAQTQLDAQASGSGWSNRIIATWDPVTQAGIRFEWSGGTPSSGIAVSTALGQELETNAADPSGQHALDYLRGDAEWSLAGGTGGVYRNRTHILGDIIDSAPIYVGAAVGPYQSASYYAFEQAHTLCAAPPVLPCREPVLYVGANDGMLHAFSATATGGQELFAYVPNGVFANLIQLTNPYYNEQHHFYVDGPPQAADVQFSNGSWHTLLVGGERAGGSSIYALDVTDPGTITSESALASKVLWEFSDPSHLGMTFSTPAIAPTAVGASAGNLGFTVFFGNGYNSASQKPYLYALDPRTGASLPGTPIDLCAAVVATSPTACNSSLANGLSSVNVISDLGGVGTPATTVYAGDLQGNVWRVDIHDPNPLNWTVTVLFKATDLSGPPGVPQPITTTPAVSLNPEFPRLAGTMVYVGTGQLLGYTDLNSTQLQSMYGVYDSGSNGSMLTRGDLVDQPMTSNLVSGYTLRFVGGGPVTLPTQNGWVVDFSLLSGERIVSDPRLVGGALSVISVQPAPTTAPTTMVPSSRSHAALARATRPQGNPLASKPRASMSRTAASKALSRTASALPAATFPATPFADSVVYLRAGEPLGGPTLGSTRAQLSDGIYHALGSTARLVPIGLGVAPPPTLQSISVSPPNPSIVQGQTDEFTATGNYSDGSTQNLTSQVTWTSSNTAVATIGPNGLASSTAVGATGITASLGGISGNTTLTVTPQPPVVTPTLVSIAVSPSSAGIYVGQTQQFTAIGTYSNGSMQDLTGMVTWSSSNSGVATIGGGGLASAVAPGTTGITATLDSISGSATLTVTLPPTPAPAPPLVSIVVTPANPTIHVGNTQQFTATAYYGDGSMQNVTSEATWTSGTPSVATIAAGGLASGVAIGTTTITATLTGIPGSTTLTVIAAPPPPTLVSITVTPINPTIYVAQTEQFVATGHYSDGTTQVLTSTAVWTSSNTTVATIAAGGLATSASIGATTITATVGSISGFTTLTVIHRPTLLSISVTPSNPTIDVSQTQQFTATGHYSDGSTQTLTTAMGLSWSSSISTVATIGSGGLATANATVIGSTTITATLGAASGSTELFVVNAPAPPPPPVCPGGDVSYLMEFNFAGGSFPSPVFNYNGPSAPTSSIVAANGVLLGGVYASAPVFNTYSGGTYGYGGNVGLVTLSNGTIDSFFQLGFHGQRYSWWEIR